VNQFAKNDGKLRDGNWILYHDIVLAHTSHLMQQFLAKQALPSGSSHHTHLILALCDFSYSQSLRKF
jgi:hypothetical protein